MIERAQGCVEQGSRSLSRVYKNKCPSRQNLSSTFFNHGAANLSTWWTEPLQSSASPGRRPRQKSAGPANSHPLHGENQVLDFLYPTKTLTFLQNRPSRGRGKENGRWRDRLPPTRSHSSIAQPSDHTQKSEDNNVSDVAQILHKLQELENLKIFDSPPERLKDVYKVKYEEVMLEIDKAISTDNVFTDSESRSAHKLHKFGTRVMNNHISKIQELLQGRSTWLSHHYVMAIKISMLRERPDQALRLYKKSLDNFQDSLATPAIVKYCLENKDWQTGVESWFAYSKTIQSEDYFWKCIKNIEGSRLVSNAMELVDYVKEERHNADTYMRQFALELLKNIFALRELDNFTVRPFDHYRLFMRLRGLVWHPSEQQYRDAIEQCLALKFPTEDGNLKLFGDNAVRLYMAMRSRIKVVPDQTMLDNLFKRACQVHNVDCKIIFDDLKENFGSPSPRLYRTYLKELLYLNDLNGFYTLLTEAKEQRGFEITPELIARALRAHAQSKQLSEALRLFDSIPDQLGTAPQMVHWNALISAHIHAMDIKGAYNLVQKMRDQGVEPDLHTFIPILRHHARKGDITTVRKLTDELKSKGIPDNVIFTQALVQALLQNDELDLARELLLASTKQDLEGERIHMWNLVLGFFAKHRSLAEITDLQSKMKESGMKPNGMTYAALASALVASKMTRKAFNLLIRAKREGRLTRMSYHLSIVIHGFYNARQYDDVFVVYRWMIRNAVAPDAGTRAILIRAAAKVDTSDWHESLIKDSPELLTRAEEILSQVIDRSSPTDPLPRYPIEGIHWDDPEEAFVSLYFDSLIYFYGQRQVFQKVDELYSAYVKFTSRMLDKPTDARNPASMQLLVALMVFHRKANKHDEVERLWQYALEKSKPLAAREGADTRKSGWVLPARSYVLKAPLAQYMLSIIAQGRSAQLPELVAGLQYMGFGMDNKCWNIYIQQLVLDGKHQQAFATTERELLDKLVRWPKRPATWLVLRDFNKRLPPSREPWNRAPLYKTLVLLAKSYFELQVANPQDFESLNDQAPRTCHAIVHMPSLDEPLQREHLRKYRK